MEIKNLFKSNQKNTPPEYFLAIEIHDSLIKTALWQVENEVASVVNIGSFESWESDDSLVNGIDASLNQAVKSIDSDPDRVVFGVPTSWLDENDKLEPTRNNLIGKLKSKLALKPIGLVTITEAIVQQLKLDEGIPATAIILEIYTTKVVVSLVRLGIVEKQEEVGRSDDLAKDVEEGLVRMESERLPVRFILTNGGDLENEEQQIISYPWQDKLKFLHLPKVETLSPDYSIKAIALAGGVEAAKANGIDVIGEDEEVKSNLVPVGEDTLSSLGFSIESPDVPAEPEPVISPPPFSVPQPLPPKRHLPKFRLPHISIKLPKVIFLALPVFLIVLLLGGLYISYPYFASVLITLHVKPQPHKQIVPIFLSGSPQTDKTTIIVSSRDLEASVTKEISTTGETIVGEKAKGTITIYNRTLQATTLKAGTRFTTSSGTVFVLDNAVAIASSSAQTEPPFLTTPGSSSAPVTATKIGVDSNIAKATQLSVDNYPKSMFIASSDADFSGGSSRAVKAVAPADLTKLLEQANLEVQANVDGQIKTEDADLRSVIVDAPTVTKKEYSHKVNEEATTVKLSLSVKASVFTYSYQLLLDTLTKEVVSKTFPGRKFVSGKTTVFIATPKKISDGVYSGEAEIDGEIIPIIDDGYYSQITGHSVESAKQLFSNLTGIMNMEVKFIPEIPVLNGNLPKNKAKITINLVPG